MADEHRVINVYTAQMGKWRQVKALGLEIFDTTVRSGHRFVAPTWEMVLGHKAGELTDEQYTEQYLNMMRMSIQEHPKQWEDLICRENLVLTCYCKSGKFCHRYLLKDIVKQQCDAFGLIFVDKGEIE